LKLHGREGRKEGGSFETPIMKKGPYPPHGTGSAKEGKCKQLIERRRDSNGEDAEGKGGNSYIRRLDERPREDLLGNLKRNTAKAKLGHIAGGRVLEERKGSSAQTRKVDETRTAKTANPQRGREGKVRGQTSMVKNQRVGGTFCLR